MSIPLSTGITGEYGPGQSRKLMENGRWLVPPAQRPKGWERMGLKEPARDPRFAELDRQIAAMPDDEPPKPSGQRYVPILEKAAALKEGQEFTVPVPADIAGSRYANQISAQLDTNPRTKGAVWFVKQQFDDGMNVTGVTIQRLEPRPAKPVEAQPSKRVTPTVVVGRQLDRVLDAVRSGASTLYEIEEATGIPKASVSANLSILTKEGKIERTGSVERKPGQHGHTASVYVAKDKVVAAVPKYEVFDRHEYDRRADDGKWTPLAKDLLTLKAGEFRLVPMPNQKGLTRRVFANQVRCALGMRKDTKGIEWSVQTHEGRDNDPIKVIRRGDRSAQSLYAKVEESVKRTETTVVTETKREVSVAVERDPEPTPVELAPPVETPAPVITPIVESPATSGKPAALLPKSNGKRLSSPAEPRMWDSFIPKNPPAAERLLDVCVELELLYRQEDSHEREVQIERLTDEQFGIGSSIATHRAAKEKVDKALGAFVQKLIDGGDLIHIGGDENPDIFSLSVQQMAEMFRLVHAGIVNELEEADRRVKEARRGKAG